MINEAWRRSAAAVEKCPRLEIQVANLSVGVRNLGSQLQSCNRALNSLRVRLQEAEAALDLAESVQNRCENDLRAANEDKKVLLRDIAGKDRELEKTRNDLLESERKLEQMLGVEKEEDAMMVEQVDVLSEESEELGVQVDQRWPKLVNQMAHWYQDLPKSEELEVHPKTRQHTTLRDHTFGPNLRSQSLGPAIHPSRKWTNSPASQPKAVSIKQMLNENDANVLLSANSCSKEDKPSA